MKSNNSIIGIIPARMASTRFPGKPLAEICGIPMIGHVYQRCRLCSMLTELYVATCDTAIFDYVTGIGGMAVMTADSHERCTDRVAEAVLKIETSIGRRADIVVLVQGDEPLVTPVMIDLSIQGLLETPEAMSVNLMGRIHNDEDWRDPNEIKVVTDQKGFALYMSRAPIPSNAKYDDEIPRLKQICVIPFRRDDLLKFNKLPATPLEKIESIDMLRIMEHGFKVKMVETSDEVYSVDTPDDLRFVEQIMKKDKLFRQYGGSISARK